MSTTSVMPATVGRGLLAGVAARARHNALAPHRLRTAWVGRAAFQPDHVQNFWSPA
jgi:hypothetical protein